jgi:hypothetical protein
MPQATDSKPSPGKPVSDLSSAVQLRAWQARSGAASRSPNHFPPKRQRSVVRRTGTSRPWNRSLRPPKQTKARHPVDSSVFIPRIETLPMEARSAPRQAGCGPPIRGVRSLLPKEPASSSVGRKPRTRSRDLLPASWHRLRRPRSPVPPPEGVGAIARGNEAFPLGQHDLCQQAGVGPVVRRARCLPPKEPAPWSEGTSRSPEGSPRTPFGLGLLSRWARSSSSAEADSKPSPVVELQFTLDSEPFTCRSRLVLVVQNTSLSSPPEPEAQSWQASRRIPRPPNLTGRSEDLVPGTGWLEHRVPEGIRCRRHRRGSKAAPPGRCVTARARTHQPEYCIRPIGRNPRELPPPPRLSGIPTWAVLPAIRS